ncbi:MAG: nucleoside triphosphate pyrophosphatase [Nannocystaceae bacterium]
MLVLASTSRYRRELLGRLGVDFEALAPDFDEAAEEPHFAVLGPEAFARRLARGKARSLVAARPDALILGADQIAVIDGELLHKPGTEDAAIDQLMRLRGRTHQLITGVALVDAATGALEEVVDHQRLTMRRYSRAEVEGYVRSARPLDCVGSYRIEDAGIRLFAAIEGVDYTGIIGLPLIAVGRLLRARGLIAGDEPV